MSQTSDLPGLSDSRSSRLTFDPIHSSQLLDLGGEPTEHRTILLRTAYRLLLAHIQHYMLSDSLKPKLKHVDCIHHALQV